MMQAMNAGAAGTTTGAAPMELTDMNKNGAQGVRISVGGKGMDGP